MIVVTTPTGDIGGKVLDTLLTGREEVRVVVRDPARLPAAVRARVDVVTGSHGDPDVVDRAFVGAEAVFWLAPPHPTAPDLDAAYAGFARPAAEAFARHGVGHVVGVSALGRGTPFADRAGLVTASLAMDDAIAGSGVAFRALANPGFMENVLRQVDAIRDAGVLSFAQAHDRALPLAATADIAAAAVRLLRDRSWTGVGEVPVLGPQDITPDEMAATLSDVLGRPVTYRQQSFEDFAAGLAGSGVSDPFLRGMVDMMRAKQDGLDDGVVRTPDTASPTTFRRWCEEVLAPAVRSAG